MQKPKPCAKCPVFYLGYCKVYAKRVNPAQRACNYGRRLIRNAYSARWMSEKRRGEKEKRNE